MHRKTRRPAHCAPGSISGAVGAAKGLLGHIPGFASGVTNFGGGLALGGENGPELVNLPGGSDVFTNGQSRRMLGGTPIVMNVYGDADARLIAYEVRQSLKEVADKLLVGF